MIPLIIILAVLFLIAIIPLGVSFEYSEDGLLVDAHIAFIRIGILPKKEKKKEKKPKKKKEKPKKEKKPKEKKQKTKRGGTVEFISTTLKSVGEFLYRFRKRLLINYLNVYYTSAAADPYDAAMNYGRATAAISAVMPLVEKHFRIKKRDIRTFVSFDGEGDKVYIDTKLTIRIWEIFYMAGSLIPVVRAFLKWSAGGKEKKNGKASDE